ncbi:MAG: chorismate lyase [Gammaproteobacteria bacterium]
MNATETAILNTRRAARWLPEACYFYAQIPVALSGWLRDRSSLTDRLRGCCKEPFSVQVVDQGWGNPALHESRALGIQHGERAMVREVLLMCGTRPTVFARTVIPVRTLSGRERRLAFLGNRPLGAYLFTDPSMHRGAVEISRLTAGNDIYQRAVSGLRKKPQTVWGRRSVFFLSDKPLLVSEFFLRLP